MEPLLELKNIYFKYPSSPNMVLQDLNFSIYPKRHVGIIGANGEGKTSFLHLCVGLLSPLKGKILFKGKIIKGEKDLIPLRKSIGLVFQNPDDQLFSPTVLEDVAFGPLNLGMNKEEARAISLWALEKVGLLGFEDRITNKLSGGEKKLLSLATILAMKPEVMLLDEPTTGLAPTTREKIIHLLQKMDIGLIIVSHDWDFLYHTTEELFVMKEGKLYPADRKLLHAHHHLHASGDMPHIHKETI